VNGLVRQLESIGLTALSLHCDNYYRSRYKPDPIAGFDTINAIDTEALLADLRAARERTLTHLRRYDMSSRVVVYRPIDESCLTTGYDLIVVEGAYGPQAILPRVLIDVVVYLETPLWRRIWRRLCRDVRERGRSPISVLHQTFWQMLPGERRFIVPLRQQAHVVVRDPVEGCRSVLARITSHG
jgi:uridine kinase